MRFPNPDALVSLIVSFAGAVSASRGASAYRGNYGNVERSGEEFRGVHKDVPATASNIHLFFSLHDYNHDGHLDGHELRIAFTEFETKEGKQITLAEVEKMVDDALNKDDTNGDGKIGWNEYLDSQRRAGNA